jgi:hypothetical protein
MRFKLWSLDGFGLFGMGPVPSLIVCGLAGCGIFAAMAERLERPVVACQAERLALEQYRAAMQVPWDAVRGSDSWNALEDCLKAARESHIPAS